MRFFWPIWRDSGLCLHRPLRTFPRNRYPTLWWKALRLRQHRLWRAKFSRTLEGRSAKLLSAVGLPFGCIFRDFGGNPRIHLFRFSLLPGLSKKGVLPATSLNFVLIFSSRPKIRNPLFSFIIPEPYCLMLLIVRTNKANEKIIWLHSLRNQ